MIKYETKRIISVQDWDELVSETYGKPYSLQQQDGCKERQVENITVPDLEAWDFENDTIPEEVNGDEMGVSFKSWLARDPKQPLNTGDDWDRKHGVRLFWERNFYPALGIIINDLHKKGLIEAGEYGIDIDW
jgi:hypothetical protein